MDSIFILEHVYEINDVDEIKHIGVFTTEVKAQEAIEELKDLPGFNKFSIDCFKISKCKLNHYEWKNGFVNWDEIDNISS